MSKKVVTNPLPCQVPVIHSEQGHHPLLGACFPPSQTVPSEPKAEICEPVPCLLWKDVFPGKTQGLSFPIPSRVLRD